MGTIRRFSLMEIKGKTGIDVFVETGTLYGHGVDYALESGINKIISIEINDELADKAIEKYSQEKKVTIIKGDSSEVIPQLASTIHEPSIFWLDAHFPGADAGLSGYRDTENYNTRVPLEAELLAISKRRLPDVIICDDLWLYEDGPFDCGSFDEHSRRHGHNITRKEVCGNSLNVIYQVYEETHSISKYYDHQGYLVILPNQNINNKT